MSLTIALTLASMAKGIQDQKIQAGRARNAQRAQEQAARMQASQQAVAGLAPGAPGTAVRSPLDMLAQYQQQRGQNGFYGQ